MEKLNPQQQRAVRHETGPLLILAGAGTGKTRVVTERMAYLLRSGVRPANLLGVTFTNKAAAEMRARLAKLTKGVNIRDLIISTFHSLCVRIIRRDAPALGYTPSFSICDQGEQLSVLRKAAGTVRGSADLRLEETLSRIGKLKSRGLAPADFARAATEEDEHVLAAVYRRYQDALRRQNSMDFDDLLVQTLRLFKERPDILDHWRDRFRHIMVDEFQDTNPAQFSLVRLLAAPRDNLCVVGDDDQSIYAWRGAMAGNILKFRDTYPGSVEITLEQNYRSTGMILSAANAVIKNNGGRREKNLWSDLGQGAPIRLTAYNDQFEEAAGIASEIRSRAAGGGGRVRWSDFAVVIRANAQSRALEDEFLAARIPHEVIGGQSLFDRKEARDVLSFLAVLANPEADNQLLRIINVPPRGIGEKTVDQLMAAAAAGRTGLLRLLAEPALVEGMAKSAAEACRRFAGQIEGWRRRLDESGPAGLVKAILDETRYTEELAHLYHDPLEAASRWNQALEVGDSLEGFAERNAGDAASGRELLADFLREATLSSRRDDDGGKKAADVVRIITVHSAKGLEFPIVFLPGLEEDQFPHKNSIEENGVEEERRLFYVAMTRARRELFLTRCRARTTRGKEQKRAPSRFLAEIPSEFLDAADTPTRREETLAWLAGLKDRLSRKDQANASGDAY